MVKNISKGIEIINNTFSGHSEVKLDGTDEAIFRAAKEIQTKRTDWWTQREERVGQIERVMLKHIRYHM